MYERLVADSIVPSKKLPSPLRLNPEMVGGPRNWQTLLALDCRSALCGAFDSRLRPMRRRTNVFFITDRRVVFNGFDMRKQLDGVGKVTVDMLGMATLDDFGVGELREVLSLILAHGDEPAPVPRPKLVCQRARLPALTWRQVVRHFRAEALRLSASLEAAPSHEQVAAMLQRCKGVGWARPCRCRIHWRSWQRVPARPPAAAARARIAAPCVVPSSMKAREIVNNTGGCFRSRLRLS